MSVYRLGQAAAILGISVDSVRRLAEGGKLATSRTRGGQRVVAGAALARFAEAQAGAASKPAGRRASARNRLPGIVTRVVRDRVSAQVEIRAGPFRLVSLLTREAADELDLQPGSFVAAVIKATSVVVEAAPIPSPRAGDE